MRELGEVRSLLSNLKFILVDSVFLLFSILKIVCKSSGKNFFVVESRGFGHTVMQPHMARSLLGSDIHLIFLLTEKRHNFRIATIFPGSISIIKRDKFFSLLVSRNLKHNIYISERIVLKALRTVLPITRRKVHSERDLMSLTTQDFNMRYPMTGLFYLMLENGSIMKKSSIRKSIDTQFFQNEGNFSKTIGFYLRKKGQIVDLGDSGRSSSCFANQVPIIEKCLERGFKVFLYGELPSKTEVDAFFKERPVFTHHSFSINKEIWDLWVPISTTGVVGAAGGGMVLPVSFGVKCLVLDGFGYWYAIPNSLHTFRLIKRQNGSLEDPRHYMQKDPWYLEIDKGDAIVDVPMPIKLKALEEFFEFLENNLQGVGLQREKLHKDNWFFWAKTAQVAPSYLKFLDTLKDWE